MPFPVPEGESASRETGAGRNERTGHSGAQELVVLGWAAQPRESVVPRGRARPITTAARGSAGRARAVTRACTAVSIPPWNVALTGAASYD